jgi:hypothetical protein
MRYDDFLHIYNAGPEATYKLLMSMMENGLKQNIHLSQLESRVKELEIQTKKNSDNSNKLEITGFAGHLETPYN